MRKTNFILVLLICTAPHLFGQIALLDRVYDYIQNKDLEKAESAILIAEKNITTANDARTYYLKSFVYKDLFTQAKDEKRDQLRNISITSLQQCRKLDHDGSFKQPLKQLSDFIVASIYNDGTECYNRQDYNKAIRHFKQYVQISELEDEYWLDAHYFIGSSYYSLNANDSALYFFELVAGKNYDQPLLFVDLSYLYFKKNNEEKAIRCIEEGVSRYPDYFDLQIAALNILAGFNKYALLEAQVEKFLSMHPDNIDVLLMAGTTYEKNSTEEARTMYFSKSEKVYRKVIDLDPKNFDANYNLGVLYYNQAVDIVNKTDFDTDIKELSKILEKSTALFEKALPLLLSIYDSRSNNLKLLQALQAIYYNLNMKAELNEVNLLIKSLAKK